MDIGSGLGVDSFIAASAAGATGSVTGVDISAGEVKHANRRAVERCAANVTFVRADAERLPFPDASFDRVVSNGAFCLVPDKETAFREVLRVLRPGGRFAVACTTLLGEGGLEAGVEWPVCMRAFMPLDEAAPMLEGIGFVDVEVDDSDSKMTMEIAYEEDEEGNVEIREAEEGEAVREGDDKDERGRHRVHVGSQEFKHLERYDMNKLCARVVLTGMRKE